MSTSDIITIPAMPVTIMGCDLSCPSLRVPANLALRVLEVLTTPGLPTVLRREVYICHAVNIREFQDIVTNSFEGGSVALASHFMCQSTVFLNAWPYISEDDYDEGRDPLYGTRLAWCRHIAKHIELELGRRPA